MLPAARATDMHVCPMWTVIVPHIGGPILPPGAPTVLILGLPAARIGDMVTCVGPPDTIASGVPNLLIGGMPAARMTDLTAHGGVIILGAPTVLYGGPAPPSPPPPPSPPSSLAPDEVTFMQTGGKSPAALQQYRDEKKKKQKQQQDQNQN